MLRIRLRSLQGIRKLAARQLSTQDSQQNKSTSPNASKSSPKTKAQRLNAPLDPSKYAVFDDAAKQSLLLRKAAGRIKTKISDKAKPSSGLTPAQEKARAEMLKPIDPDEVYKANLARFTNDRSDLPKPIWLKATASEALEPVNEQGLTETQTKALPAAKKVFMSSIEFAINTVALEPETQEQKEERERRKRGKTLDELLDEKIPSKAPYQMPLWDAEKPLVASPFPGVPKVAVCGRSNVGKSSLLNTLLGKNVKVFQTSKTPGRTKFAEYACVGGKLALVDLPGYGYAKVSKKKQLDMSTRLTKFFEKDMPRRVLLLIDARHGVLENDKQFMERLTDANVPFQVVLTKVDRVSPRGLNAVVKDTRFAIARESSAFPDVLITSSAKKIGMSALQAEIAIACGVVAPNSLTSTDEEPQKSSKKEFGADTTKAPQ